MEFIQGDSYLDELKCGIFKVLADFELKLNNLAFILIPVPLGSIPELPADSCAEIKASEGVQAVSGNYWLDSTWSGHSSFIHCDIKTGSK